MQELQAAGQKQAAIKAAKFEADLYSVVLERIHNRAKEGYGYLSIGETDLTAQVVDWLRAEGFTYKKVNVGRLDTHCTISWSDK